MSKKNRLKRKEAADAAGLGLNSSPAGIFRFPPWLFFGVLLAWFFVVYRKYLPLHSDVNNLIAGGLFRFDFIAALVGFFGVLPSNLLNLLFLSLLVLLARGIGGGLLSLFRVEVTAAERFIFSLGLGFGAIAYLMLLLGALGALYKPFILAVFLLGCAVSAFRLRIWNFRSDTLKNELGEIAKLGFAWKALSVLGALFLFLNIVMAFVPEIFYDSQVYHLAAPDYYLLKHQIQPMRFLSHSNFPLNLSMLYMLALSLSNEILARMIHCVMGLLAVLLTYFSVKRIYNAKAALFAALILASTPIFAMNSWTCGNDVGVTFFFALAYVAYLDWLRTGGAGEFALFSVFAGISAGMKYTAAFWVAGIAVSLAVGVWRSHGPARAMKKLSLYLGTVFLFTLPWMLKNFIFTRNPVQPFFHTLLGGENLKIVGGGGGGIINSPLNVFGFRLADFLSSPWKLMLAGGDSLSYIGPVFLLLLPCLLLFRKTDRLVKHSLVIFCAGYAVWYMGTPAYRYMLPLFVALAVCLGWAAYFVSERFKMFKLLVAVMLAVNFTSVLAMALALGLDGYLAKGLSKDEFLSVNRPSYPNPPYAAISWINKNLPQDAKVFFIGESRPFRMERDFISYSIENNVQPLMVYLRRAGTPEDFYAALRAENFTHLLINYREALRNNASYREFDWTDRERKIFDGFWEKHVRLDYFREGVYVYSVLPEKGQSYTPNILEGLERDGWKNENLLNLLNGNRMWASCLDEYGTFARYGYDVGKQLEYYRALLAKELPEGL
ncbi:MAG: glycosyltransferase family 39 protein [Elusimicrobiota bacterium]